MPTAPKPPNRRTSPPAPPNSETAAPADERNDAQPIAAPEPEAVDAEIEVAAAEPVAVPVPAPAVEAPVTLEPEVTAPADEPEVTETKPVEFEYGSSDEVNAKAQEGIDRMINSMEAGGVTAQERHNAQELRNLKEADPVAPGQEPPAAPTAPDFTASEVLQRRMGLGRLIADRLCEKLTDEEERSLAEAHASQDFAEYSRIVSLLQFRPKAD